MRRSSEAGRLGYVGKGAIAIVTVENVTSPIGDEQIFETIVVVVQKCTAAAGHLDDVVLAVNAAVDRHATQTSSCRDVLEARAEWQSGKFSSRLDGGLACGHSLAKTRGGRCA